MSVRVETVSVEWLLQNITYSVDRGDINWPNMIVSKMQDSGVKSVYDSIVSHGFNVPICVNKIPGGWQLGNGHHRMCLAILMCLDTILVLFDDDDEDYMHGDITQSDGWYVDYTNKWTTLTRMIDIGFIDSP